MTGRNDAHAADNKFPGGIGIERNHQILMLINHYLCALDTEDAELLGTCFSKAVVAIYHAGTAQERRESGHDRVVGRLVANMRNYTTRTHALANFSIRPTAAGASCVSNVTATLVRNAQVIVRGIRYTDEFRHESEGLRIIRREHRPLWQYHASRAPLQTPSSPPPEDEVDYSGLGQRGSTAGS